MAAASPSSSPLIPTTAPELFVVRQARPEDLPALLWLDRHSGGEDLWEEADFNEVYSTHVDGRVLVGEHHDRLVCYAAFALVNEAEGGQVCIFKLVVHKDYRRRGIGRSLLQALHILAPEGIVLVVARESDLEAQLFLKACGCECIRTTDEYYDTPPENGYIFRLG